MNVILTPPAPFSGNFPLIDIFHSYLLKTYDTNSKGECLLCPGVQAPRVSDRMQCNVLNKYYYFSMKCFLEILYKIL